MALNSCERTESSCSFYNIVATYEGGNGGLQLMSYPHGSCEYLRARAHCMCETGQETVQDILVMEMLEKWKEKSSWIGSANRVAVESRRKI